MKRNIENGLALAGALIVILGVSAAASSALAEDAASANTTAVTTETAADTTAAKARAAHEEAAHEVVESMAADNQVDLDIRLADHTSDLVAKGS